mmetsp:Transcript_31570/g.52121  ORF Transcript_31570/g.52121 Transcript_31570/m.52121 type:complete len:83 (-) Transcript_31570:838-1086(-)
MCARLPLREIDWNPSRTMLTRRAIIWTSIVVPVALYYWPQLVNSLEGSTPIAGLIVLMAWICGCVDLNEMTGQPDDEHDHHD